MSDPQPLESLDPIEDILEALDKIDIAYVMAIGKPGECQTRLYSNLPGFRKVSVEAAREAINAHLDWVLEDMEDEEEDAP